MLTNVCKIFENIVSRFPESPALLLGNDHFISYSSLNTKANRLAHYLENCGIKRNDLVGVYVEPSIEAVISFLAILKAGGAYVPLDVNCPERRLASLISTAGMGIILSRRQLASRVNTTGAMVICLDEIDKKLDSESLENPNSVTSPDDLAYVMFTSGSTGTPKGVCIPHRGIVRLVTDVEYVSLSSTDVLLQSAPITFDAATFEIWGALLNGGALAIPPAGFDLKDIGQLIRQYGVTTLWLTARLFDVVVDDMVDSLRPLRQLLFGGEQASLHHVEKAFRALPNCKLINGYGPTENTTFTCAHTITASDFEQGVIPIGRPISKTRVYILDEELRQVTDGSEGELYIAGDGLALGYLNRPDLTAEKFINVIPGESIVYRSGDRVRMMGNGNIEYLGRRDSQVKIRGFRIELGEIEAHLQKCPGILQAAVIAIETPSGQKALAAYYRPDPRHEPPQHIIAGLLTEWLPAYMVPSHLIAVTEFPLTNNGKLDIKKLPMPYFKSLSVPEPEFLQLGDTEKKLLSIWRETLANKNLGIRDNFFECGGDSLAALRVSLEVEMQMGTSLPMSYLFQFPTIELLSAYLTSKEGREQVRRPSLVPIQISGSKSPLFCVPWKGGTSISFKAFANKLGPERPVYGLEPIGENGKEISFKTIPEMASHFVEDILSVQPYGPYYICGASRGGIVAWEIARQLEDRDMEVALVGLFDSPEPNFHLMAKPFERNLRRKLYMWLRYVSLFYQGSRIILKMGEAKDFARFFGFATNWLTRRKPQMLQTNVRTSSRDLTQYSYTPYAEGQLLVGYAVKACLAKAVLIRSKYDYFDGWEKDVYLGWKPFALSGVTIHHVPGQHLGLLREPFVWILAEKIRAYLEAEAVKQGEVHTP